MSLYGSLQIPCAFTLDSLGTAYHSCLETSSSVANFTLWTMIVLILTRTRLGEFNTTGGN